MTSPGPQFTLVCPVCHRRFSGDAALDVDYRCPNDQANLIREHQVATPSSAKPPVASEVSPKVGEKKAGVDDTEKLVFEAEDTVVLNYFDQTMVDLGPNRFFKIEPPESN